MARAFTHGSCWLILTWALAGCAADSSSKHGGNNLQSGAGASGAAGASASAGVTGGDPSLVGGGGGAGTTGVGPVLPPTSTQFTKDDTGMSGLDQATLTALKQGGAACNTMLLYPYDNTVFPAGLISPLMQWSGAADAAYVKMTYDKVTTVSYEFAVKGANPGELRVPQDAWNEIVRRSQKTPLHVTLSVKSGGTVSTCQHQWVIAQGVMKGTIYYNTYSAPMAKSPSQGAVMRVAVGSAKPEIFLQYMGTKMVTMGTGPCISCHSVSADGSTMVAALHDYDAFGGFGGGAIFGGGAPAGMGGKTYDTYSYPVTAMVQPNSIVKIPNAEFSALYPDGTRVLAMGNPQCTGGSDTFPRAPNNFPLVAGPQQPRVVDTKTGMELPSKGLDPNWYLWMPQFSPDGKHVVFNHAKPDGGGGTDRRELAVLDYDYATNTFSNLKVIASKLGPAPSLAYSPMAAGAGATPAGIGGCMIPAGQSPVAALTTGTCTGPCYPAFPFFTPDSRGVVFSLISSPDFTSAFPGRDDLSMSELWYADVASGQTVVLKTANTSLDPKDSTSNFFPTVLPVQVGGYFWAFWTSRRSWGTHLDSNGPAMGGGGFMTSPAVGQAYKKRIWATALRIPNGTGDVKATGPLTDLSSPGFYFEGQSETGNVRAYATLSPCVAKGASCTSGLDCCNGYCSIKPGDPAGMCTDVVPTCSKTNEKCSKSSDCCKPSKPDEPVNICLGGFCGFVTPS